MINQPSTNPQIEILVVDTHALTHEFEAGKALRRAARQPVPQPPTDATEAFLLGWEWQHQYQHGQDLRLGGQPLIMAKTTPEREGWLYMDRCHRDHWLAESAQYCNHELTY